MIEIKKQSFIYKIFMTAILSVIFSIGISFFLDSSNLISTGLTGVAQIISIQSTVIPFSVVYFVLNIPGIILGFFRIGKRFTIYSLVSVTVVAITTEIIRELPINTILTNDIILNTVFAGGIMGFAIGGLLKIGASSGGSDFYCIWLFKKYGIPFSRINISINIGVVLISAILFSVEIALFTLFYIFIREIMMNLFYTNNQRVTVWIVGEDLKEVSEYIHNELGRGTSIFKEVKGGYTGHDKEAIMVILNVFQFSILKEEIYKINPHVFVTANKTYDVLGNYSINK